MEADNLMDGPRVPHPIRILVADDHQTMRDGLIYLLGKEEDFQVVGEARDGDEAVAAARLYRPDVVLMDVAMVRKNGVEATAEIHREYPEITVIGLSLYDDDITRASMLEAGAGDFLCKTLSPRHIVQAVRSAGKAGKPLPSTA